MRILLALILATMPMYSFSQHRHNHSHGYGWITPLIIGGVVGYAITRPQQPPPPNIIYVPQPPPYGYRWESFYDVNCNCYKWLLIQG